MGINKYGKKTEIPEGSIPEKQEIKVRSPYMSKGIYNNYAKGMKEKNQLRVKKGLKAIPLRTFEEWSDG